MVNEQTPKIKKKKQPKWGTMINVHTEINSKRKVEKDTLVVLTSLIITKYLLITGIG